MAEADRAGSLQGTGRSGAEAMASRHRPVEAPGGRAPARRPVARAVLGAAGIGHGARARARRPVHRDRRRRRAGRRGHGADAGRRRRVRRRSATGRTHRRRCSGRSSRRAAEGAAEVVAEPVGARAGPDVARWPSGCSASGRRPGRSSRSGRSRPRARRGGSGRAPRRRRSPTLGPGRRGPSHEPTDATRSWSSRRRSPNRGWTSGSTGRRPAATRSRPASSSR